MRILRSLRALAGLFVLALLYQNCVPAAFVEGENFASSCEYSQNNSDLFRLSTFEYEQILKDLAPDVFADNWASDLPHLPSVNSFDNRVNQAIDATMMETYLSKAEELSLQIMASKAVMNNCDQQIGSTGRTWANCALPIVQAVGQSLYRRPLRSSEVSKFKTAFDATSATVTEINRTSTTEIVSHFDGVTESSAGVIARGWAFDPDWEERNVELHFYVKPAGSNAAQVFIGSRIANETRDDVNRVYSIKGKHGFQFLIPKEYVNGTSYEIYAYTIGAGNRLARNSPRAYSFAAQRGEVNYEGQYRTGFTEGLSQVIASMLISPNFLYKAEFLPNGFLAEESQFKKASHLSFLIRSSFPDEQLFSLAKAGRLSDDEVRNEAKRLLASYSSRFAKNFAGQWLNFRQNLDHSDPLLKSMAKESELVFNEHIAQNLNVQSLLQPNFTFVNSLLANHYGEGRVPQNSSFAKISTNQRGGILDQGHFLMTTSGPTKTNPVSRGIWVLDKVLCKSLPPLTAATFEQIDEVRKTIDPTASVERQMELHRNASTTCYSCHSHIDPMGLPMEQYDHTGRFKSEWAMQPIQYENYFVSNTRNLASALDKTKEFSMCFERKLNAYISGADSVGETVNSRCDSNRNPNGTTKGVQDSVIDTIFNEVSSNGN